MFLKNKNIIFKIRRSKVTDYAALKDKDVIFRLVAFHLPHASYAFKSYWLCDRCDRDFMLKKSAAINDVKT